MATNLWQGAKVRLRAMEPGDWPEFYDWNSDTEQARRSYAIPFPISRVAQEKWAAAVAAEREKDDAFRFVVETLDGQFAGAINSHSCDRKNGTFKYGLGIREAHQRKGYAREAICLLMRYFFEELRYQKVTAHVYSFNDPSICLHESLGFVLEGRVRRMVYTDGEYHDEITFGMTVEEFRSRVLPTM